MSWIKFDNDDYKTYPPEGETVMTTDGNSIYPLWYLWSSEYRWMNDLDENDEEIPLPFQPIHWMKLEDYKAFERDNKIDELFT
jgi:hypothetical protein